MDTIIEYVTRNLFRPDVQHITITSSNFRWTKYQGQRRPGTPSPRDIKSIPRLPPHRLELKEGMPVVLLWNDRHQGYANGNLAIIQGWDAGPDGISQLLCMLATGKNKGRAVTLSRVDVEAPIDQEGTEFCIRRQFPVRPWWAVTIRKAQGKTLHAGGLYLPTPVQEHGDLYVALSRFTSMHNVRVLASSHTHPRDGEGTYTPNIVKRDLLLVGAEAS